MSDWPIASTPHTLSAREYPAANLSYVQRSASGGYGSGDGDPPPSSNAGVALGIGVNVSVGVSMTGVSVTGAGEATSVGDPSGGATVAVTVGVAGSPAVV